MLFMNEHEIDQAVARHAENTIFGMAARKLSAFRTLVNANSDGWPHWAAAPKAAERLIKLLQSGDDHGLCGPACPWGLTDLQYALTPIKAFCTRKKLDYTSVAEAGKGGSL